MFVNTILFSEEAIRFQKEGLYCPYPEGTYQHYEYWMEQNRRCLEGYTVGGVYIPGAYYFYLNFTQMNVKNEKTGRKQRSFPRFTDVDFEYFNIYERAKKEKKGIILVKPRRTGFSQKHAGIITHEYNFFRDSKCIIGAYDSKYSDNTMSMVLDNMNFLNANTEWAKERNPDTRDHVIARYRKKLDNGIEVWAGKMSEVRAITFKDNPFASIGLSSNIFIFEEAGKFPNIIQSYNISEPCWKDGDDMIGIPILYGTGGDMEGGTVEFSEMFYEPEKYNLLSFDNIWDDDRPNTKCGWFLPASRMRFGEYKDPYGEHPEWKGIKLVDDEGNSNEEVARQSILDFRKLKDQGTDLKAKRDAITQYPLKPQEAFLQSSSVYFPVLELKRVLAKLTPEELAKHNVGILRFEDNVLKWEDIQDGKPYREWPVKEHTEGLIEIFELPRKDNGKIDKYRYIAGIDHYGRDLANSDSLGCIFIFDRLTRRIVAEYTGRPESTNVFYETCRRLLLFYDAKAMYESNITNLFHYFEQKKSLYLLEDTPQNLRDRNTWREGSNTSKGIVATAQINNKAKELIKVWLLEKESENSETLNLERIRSYGLLKELIHYNPDPKLRLNYDRISALGMVMLYDATLTEYQSTEVREKRKNQKLSDYFNKFKFKQNLYDKWLLQE